MTHFVKGAVARPEKRKSAFFDSLLLISIDFFRCSRDKEGLKTPLFPAFPESLEAIGISELISKQRPQRTGLTVNMHLLESVRILSFFPWLSSEPTGAWLRFSCMIRTFIYQGADVTVALFEPKKEFDFERLHLRYFQ